MHFWPRHCYDRHFSATSCPMFSEVSRTPLMQSPFRGWWVRKTPPRGIRQRGANWSGLARLSVCGEEQVQTAMRLSFSSIGPVRRCSHSGLRALSLDLILIYAWRGDRIGSHRRQVNAVKCRRMLPAVW